MRVLLDENVPVDLAPELTGQFGVLVTMDQNLPFQQNLTTTTLGVILVRAPSNRLIHVRPLVHGILAAMVYIQPGEMRRVGA